MILTQVLVTVLSESRDFMEVKIWLTSKIIVKEMLMHVMSSLRLTAVKEIGADIVPDLCVSMR